MGDSGAWRRLEPGFRAGLPAALASFLLGVSFGVLATPVMGSVAPIVMSAVVFGGSAQFAATAVLAAGGGAAPAIVAGVLLNARFLPMGVAVAPSLPGGPLKRALLGWTVVDASFAIASRGGGRFDRDFLLGSSAASYPAWFSGTVIGVLGGDLLDPQALGLDALFPAFFLGLMGAELRNAEARIAALLGAGIALALVPFTPPGVPVLVASAAALIGLRPRARSAREQQEAAPLEDIADSDAPAG